MHTQILFYNAETDKGHFDLAAGMRPWGILLAISKGSYRLVFPETGHCVSVAPYEVTYVPPHTAFQREITEPIDFYQFAFSLGDTRDPLYALRTGKLPIPHEQVRSTLAVADRIPYHPAEADRITEHVLHRLLIDNRLHGGDGEMPCVCRELASVSEYVLKNLHTPLSVATLAKRLNLSHNALILKFKKEFHLTPSDYIAMHRIKRAKQLLLDNDLSMAEIAERCGYANAYYFSNAFKKSEGISPSAFRKTYIG